MPWPRPLAGAAISIAAPAFLSGDPAVVAIAALAPPAVLPHHPGMDIFGPVDSIAHNIQLAVAPVFLLTGIGSILNVLAARLGRVVDRARRVEADLLAHQSATAILPPAMLEDARRELIVLGRRIAAANWAIVLCTLSALLIAIVVAILFIGDLVPMHGTSVVALLFVAAMLLLIGGLMLFLYEVQIALRSVRVNAGLVL